MRIHCSTGMIKALFISCLIAVSACSQGQFPKEAGKTDSIPTCNTNGQFNANQDLVKSGNSYGRASVGEKVARILFVVDNDLYIALGSNVSACTTFVQNEVAKSLVPYAAIPVRYKISGIKILLTTSPYSLNITQTLINFNNDYLNEPNVDAKVLLTTKYFGGIAWIGGINSSTSNTAVCQVFAQSNYYSSFTIAHEIGHLYGSIHTHDCWKWPNGQTKQIDSCYAGCGSSLTTFNQIGTVMSYCYNKGAIKQPMEFHFLCADTIRKTLAKNSSIPIEGTVTPPSLTTFKVSIKGAVFTGNTTTRDTLFAVDGLATRFLSQGPTTITYTFSQSVSGKVLTFKSGYNGGSPNLTLILKVDGVLFNLGYVRNILFTKPLPSGKVFEFVTTGESGISRTIDLIVN